MSTGTKFKLGDIVYYKHNRERLKLTVIEQFGVARNGSYKNRVTSTINIYKEEQNYYKDDLILIRAGAPPVIMYTYE